MGADQMINHPDQADRLLARMRAALPMPARMTPRLLAKVQQRSTYDETLRSPY